MLACAGRVGCCFASSLPYRPRGGDPGAPGTHAFDRRGHTMNSSVLVTLPDALHEEVWQLAKRDRCSTGDAITKIVTRALSQMAPPAATPPTLFRARYDPD